MAKPSINLVGVFLTRLNGSDLELVKNLKNDIHDMIDYVQEYNDADECDKFIRSVRYEYIFIVVTPCLVTELLENNIHQIRHVQSIFLFDPNQAMTLSALTLVQNSSFKMQGNHVSPNALLKNICDWIHIWIHNSDRTLSPFVSFPSGSMTTNVVNNIADFSELWFPLYIDLLLELPMDDLDMEHRCFVKQCRHYFHQNTGALKDIERFENFYYPNAALHYYSCDSFLYRLMNRALRCQSIEAISTFRFILLHIRDQLQLAHQKFFNDDTLVGTSKIFYRGQRMFIDELAELQRKHRDGTLITTNSYFSTSEREEVARLFAGRPCDTLISVLFKITADIKCASISQRKPFARISDYSMFGTEESEVLFSIASFYKIDHIHEESTGFWVINMTFIDEDCRDQYVIEDFYALRSCSIEMKLIKIGDLLANHSSQGISRAEEFYQVMKKFQTSDLFKAACLAGNGWLAYHDKKLTLAIEKQNEAVLLYEKLKNVYDKNEALTYLFISSYNCIGACLRRNKNYREALIYYNKADVLLLKVPIDKYAMYQGYRNVPSINIALTHKLSNEISLAWERYKKILACEMHTSTRFHGHTYLTIAQAGIRDAYMNQNTNELDRCTRTWKAFLDLSLTNLSSSYRRSIISGVLDIGFQYANNSETRSMAIEYFEKVISISLRFVQMSLNDYQIVLKSYNELACLYSKNHQHTKSIDYALKALTICRGDDLTGIVECYTSLMMSYQQQISDRKDDMTPDDISKRILDNPFVSPITDSNILLNLSTYQRNEFTFGQWPIKKCSSTFLRETEPERCLMYCRLKLAAALNDVGNQNDKVRYLLKEVTDSVTCSYQIQQICMNNMHYLNGNFDAIIDSYQVKLENDRHEQQALDNRCIDEDGFSYIAHLYEKKGNLTEEEHWYRLSIEYFKSNHHLCEHTATCFRLAVEYHKKTQRLKTALNICNEARNHYLAHGSLSYLVTSVQSILLKLITYLEEKEGQARSLVVYEELLDLLFLEPDDINDIKIDQLFQKMTTENIDSAPHIINGMYEEYIEVQLRNKFLPFDCYVLAVEPAFRTAIYIYTNEKNYRKSIKTYQQLINLIIDTTRDHQAIEAAFKTLALDFEIPGKLETALDMYTLLGNYILKHQRKSDVLLTGFIIVRCKLIRTRGVRFTENVRSACIQLIKFYHNAIEPSFVIQDFTNLNQNKSDCHTCETIYWSLLELCFKYRSEGYVKHMQKNVDILRNRPDELISFIRQHRVDYKPLIFEMEEKYGNRPNAFDLKHQPPSNIDIAISQWLYNDEIDSDVHRSELLFYLLEHQSIDDECLALGYEKLGDIENARRSFDIRMYDRIAFKFNYRACYRYLHYIYPRASTEERKKLEKLYEKYFFIELDPSSDQISFHLISL